MTPEEEKIETCRTTMGAMLDAYKDYCVTPLEGEEPEEGAAETCRTAMKAMLDVYKDYCVKPLEEPDGVNYIKFAGDVIEYPDSVSDIMDRELSGDEKVEEIARTAWAETAARERCEGVSDPELTPSEVDTCVKRLKSTLANEVYFQRLK